ncbi:ABC transporter ATP-binding protein [Halostagnicola kamekurae]|uniref:Amino acid/amide ABC transporter ATP-binding protein 2, HAAT family n=1 Tax=Halostagnicola kamekurae TaxID=619731 RepID=A0A1I6P9A2_9EURY|nr:ABC transporter ATP-binding protein [Halostagnicola kamekurae]SFS36733.1 amino acid/amide ABC transporter ATP-binding protein 2, HAAT family [Halostagnicola kamekurae]
MSTTKQEIDTVLSVENLSVSYGKVQALEDVNVDVKSGETVAVIGPNGAGKSTLVDTIGGFHDYDGSIRYNGTEVADSSTSNLIADGLFYCTERRDLFDYMSVEQNLRLGSYLNGEGEERRLEEVFDLFPRLEERRTQETQSLSGGEMQMLSLGRGLMSDPEFLILDEPSIGLAPVILQDISEALESIQELSVEILICEQNITFALEHADRLYLLENGSVRRSGTPDSLESDKFVETYIGG